MGNGNWKNHVMSRHSSVQTDEECEHCGNTSEDIPRGQKCCALGNIAGVQSRRSMSLQKSRPGDFSDE